MSMLWRTAVAELRAQPSRFALVLFALSIGLWGVGSMTISNYILRHDLMRNFSNTLPAHVVLTSHDFARLDLEKLRMRPGIAAVSFRDLSMQRIEVAPDEWIPLWLFGVSDFDNLEVARFFPEAGSFPPPPGTVVVERVSERIVKLTPQQRLRASFTHGLVPLAISGTVFDPALAPANQDHFIYAYTDAQTYRQLTGEASHQRLLVRLSHPDSKANVEKYTTELIDELQRQGIHIDGISIPEPETHPHQWQLNVILLIQGTISTLALAMAAVLVSQMISALLAKQVRQIGILKAIGASRGQVLAIYGMVIALLGLGAALLGTPLAVASGYGYAYFIAYVLNFEILTTQLPHWFYLLLIASALLLPLLLSLPTLLRGTRVSVREAISDYGIQVDAREGELRSISTRLPLPLLLPLRNTLRRRRRLLVTVLTMALGVAIFSTGFNMRQSLASLLAETADSMRYDIRVVFKSPISDARAQALFTPFVGIRRWEGWSGGKGVVQSSLLASSRGLGIIALPVETSMLNPKMMQGHWLASNDALEVVLNSQAWKHYGYPPVGTALDILPAQPSLAFTLVGVVEEFDTGKVYLSQTLYSRLTPSGSMVNSVVIAADDHRYEAVVKLKQTIENRLTQTALEVSEVMSHAERLKIIYDHLNIILIAMLILAFTVLLVSALGMGSAMAINILERTREIAVMRAIGATPQQIERLFMAEGLALCAVSLVLGMMLSWPLSLAGAHFLGELMLGGASLHSVESIEGVVITLLATTGFSLLASRQAVWRVLGVATHEALAYE